jgi:AraC-like DNA-binding protein
VSQPANHRPAIVPGVVGEVMQHPAGETIGNHSHDDAQLSVVLKGTMKIRCQGGWWLAPAGRGIWIPAGVKHSANYSEMASFVLLKIDPDAAAALPPDVRSIAVSDLLRELSLAIGRLPSKEEDADEEELMARLILKRIRNADATPFLFLPSGTDARVLRVTEFLRADPANDASLDALATIGGSSRRTLSRLFLSDTGMTFARWRDHLRIVTALDRLVRGVPIIQVALDLGYNRPVIEPELRSHLAQTAAMELPRATQDEDQRVVRPEDAIRLRRTLSGPSSVRDLAGCWTTFE